jgi:hypothetical protein
VLGDGPVAGRADSVPRREATHASDERPTVGRLDGEQSTPVNPRPGCDPSDGRFGVLGRVRPAPGSTAESPGPDRRRGRRGRRRPATAAAGPRDRPARVGRREGSSSSPQHPHCRRRTTPISFPCCVSVPA